MTRTLFATACVLFALAATATAQGRHQSSDFLKLRSVGEVQWSHDGTRIAYTVTNNPHNQLLAFFFPSTGLS